MKRVFAFLIVPFLTSCMGKDNSGITDNIERKKNALQFLSKDSDTISLNQLLNERGLKSLSIAVFENYEILWSEAVGVKFDSIPIDVNTAYSTASISKPITATLCAILEDKGLIDLDAPVNTYLKRWQLPQNEFTKDVDVTLAHLLSHTAGTTQGGFTDFYHGYTIPTILESIKGNIPGNDAVSITFEPGTDWRYSGGGYTIAMMALEDHFNKSLADLAHEFIFGPMGLKNTTMKQPNEEGFLKNVAKAHDEQGNVVGTGIPITPQVSASGLWSTPTEMALILIEIQKALNGKGSDLISEKVAKRITAIETIQGMRGWSLGWERMNSFGNQDWFSHGGANTGVGGHVYATMEGGNGVVMLANGPNNVRIPVTEMLLQNIVETHDWGYSLPWMNKEELPEHLISKIQGRYKDIKFGPVIEIKEEDGRLYIPMAWGGLRYNLVYIGENTFVMNEMSGKFKFNLDSDPLKIKFLREDGDRILAFDMFEKVE